MSEKFKKLAERIFCIASLLVTVGFVIYFWSQDKPENNIGPYSQENAELAPHEHDQFNPHVAMAPRSGSWPTVRKHFLQSPGNDSCAVCGSKEKLEVHHVDPFHLNPEKELDPTNLITLCHEHHFHLGHLGNWKNSNPNVRVESKKIHDKLNSTK